MSQPLSVLVVGNLSDHRCGFQNYTQQLITALEREPRVRVEVWDGTYPVVYQRQQGGAPWGGMLPLGVERYDVVHLIWHAMTMNHYHGVDWEALTRRDPTPVISWFDGGPSDAFCPFARWMQVKWVEYPKPGYHQLDYPVPDWVEGLPKPAVAFTVGASSVRGDGIGILRTICERHGWAMNLPTAGAWRSVEDEIRRLARSTVNVCWYNTPDLWRARASAPSMLLASGRPLLINGDPLLEHLWDAPDVYHGRTTPEDPVGDLEDRLVLLEAWQTQAGLVCPTASAEALSWTRATAKLVQVWQEARHA